MEPEARVLAEMLDYITNVVERPSPVFSGMPICPFARKFKDRIRWVVAPIKLEDVVGTPLGSDLMLLFVDPRKELPIGEFAELMRQAQEMRPDCFVIWGHPANEYSVNGVRTNSEPYPNVQVTDRAMINELKGRLRKTKYYDNFTGEEIGKFFDAKRQEEHVPPAFD